MALETGSVTADLFAADAPDSTAPAPAMEALVLSYGAHLGEGFKAARESRRLSIQDVSDVTRVHPRCLEALEALDMSRLPSRPFAIGFVRSYARVLGVDEDRAVDRFKADAPDANEPFRAPVGVSDDGDPRLALVGVAAALVVGAIVVWNVAQRAMEAREDPVAAPVVQAAPPPAPAIPKGQAVTLGPSLPAPVESTIPKPYVPPGLPGAVATNAVTGDPTRPIAAAETLPEMRVSNPNAPVFGAPADQSVISLRARKSVALVVKTADGKAIFSRVLSAGETYRAPLLAGLSIDVSDPTGVDVFRAGQFTGQLPGLVTAASKLGG